MKARARRSGFTLLEVMVALGVLAVALVSIFASEATAIKVGNRAKRISVATLLARCKMAEIEETIANKGVPAIREEGEDACCEDAEWDGFTCVWKVERLVLPDKEVQSDLPVPGATAAPASPDQPASLLGMMEQGATSGGFAQMTAQFAYPMLKPAIEDQVRRATVEVHWKEGDTDRSFDVVQFIVGNQGAATPGPGALTNPAALPR